MITVTIQFCVQVGENSFKDARFSRNFSKDMPIKTMLEWAGNMGVKNPSISDLVFSDFTGSSS